MWNVCCLSAVILTGIVGNTCIGEDWPWWRGPNRDGVASPDQNPPLSWSDTENVLWKTPLPGRGHGSAIVVGDIVYITAADRSEEKQLLICLDRTTGKEVWSTTVHQGGFTDKGNKKATLASTTPAHDGSHIFVNFLNAGAVHTSAVNASGDVVWQTKISDYVVHQGYGSSPAIYGDLVIVSADNKGSGAIAALRRDTGEFEWQHQRPNKPNYPSPIILNIGGRDQLLMTGCDLVSSFDPLTGKSLWEVEGATTECVTSTVTDGRHVFTSGGYPENHIAAVAADGSGKLVWKQPVRNYVPSMLVKDDHLYAVLDTGIATCRVAATGEELWKGRLSGTVSSSPVLVGDRIFVTNEGGTTFVFAASPDKFELFKKNELNGTVYSTPVFCDSQIYVRVAHGADDERQEFLYCLGHDR